MVSWLGPGGPSILRHARLSLEGGSGDHAALSRAEPRAQRGSRGDHDTVGFFGVTGFGFILTQPECRQGTQGQVQLPFASLVFSQRCLPRDGQPGRGTELGVLAASDPLSPAGTWQ